MLSNNFALFKKWWCWQGKQQMDRLARRWRNAENEQLFVECSRCLKYTSRLGCKNPSLHCFVPKTGSKSTRARAARFFGLDDVALTSLMFKLSKRVNLEAKKTVKPALSAGKRLPEGHVASSLPLIGWECGTIFLRQSHQGISNEKPTSLWTFTKELLHHEQLSVRLPC